MPNISTIACDVFKNELKYLDIDTSEFHFFEMGLHDNPTQLSREIQGAIDEIEKKSPDTEQILICYGFCGGGLSNLKSKRAQLIIPRVHDCLALFIGDNAQYEEGQRKAPATYYFCHGWVDGGRVPGPDRKTALKELYTNQYDYDEEMVEELLEMDDEAFEHYQSGLYINTTNNETVRNTCESCIKSNGWTFKEINADLSWLQKLFSGPWDDPQKFVVKNPGDAPIKSTANGNIFE